MTKQQIDSIDMWLKFYVITVNLNLTKMKAFCLVKRYWIMNKSNNLLKLTLSIMNQATHVSCYMIHVLCIVYCIPITSLIHNIYIVLDKIDQIVLKFPNQLFKIIPSQLLSLLRHTTKKCFEAHKVACIIDIRGGSLLSIFYL